MAITFHNVLSVGLLGEETQESNVLVRRSLKVDAKEPVDGANEFNLELGRKQAFEVLIDVGVFGVVDKIVLVDPEVNINRLICGCGGRDWGGGNTLKKTRVMKTWLKTHFNKDIVDNFLPVSS